MQNLFYFGVEFSNHVYFHNGNGVFNNFLLSYFSCPNLYCEYYGNHFDSVCGTEIYFVIIRSFVNLLVHFDTSALFVSQSVIYRYKKSGLFLFQTYLYGHCIVLFK